MGNKRNSRTTHPRKQARRERAKYRFGYDPTRIGDEGYMKRKEIERIALGL